MNFYEQQLRNIFGNDDNIKYIGRACYIGLDSETKVKASFVTGIVANQYNALRMEVTSPALSLKSISRAHICLATG